MFLRFYRMKTNGAEYRYASIVETVRTAKGPRQQTVYYLKELNASGVAGRFRPVEVMTPAGESRAVRLVAADMNGGDEPGSARILLPDIHLERVRQFGACYVGWHLWKTLHLDDAFPTELGVEAADIPWSRVIGLLAVYRLCVPRSRWVVDPALYSMTALRELLNVPLSKLHDKRLSRCVQLLAACIPRLHDRLRQNCARTAPDSCDVLLYDMRNGAHDGGRMILAVTEVQASPISHETFAVEGAGGGFERAMDMVSQKFARARSVCFYGKGILRRHEIESLRAHGFGYAMVVPRSELPDCGEALLGQPWDRCDGVFEWKWSGAADGDIRAIVRRTNAAGPTFSRRAVSRLEQNWAAFDRFLATRDTWDRPAIEQRLRKVCVSGAPASDFYHVELAETQDRLRLEWYPRESPDEWQPSLEERRFVRMDIGADEPAAVAARIQHLDGLERAFGSMAAELSGAANGQLDFQGKANLGLAFLSYSLWAALQQSVNAGHIGRTPAEVLRILSGIRLFDIVMPTADGGQVVLRRLTKPSDEQQQLLTALSIGVPRFSSGVYEQKTAALRAQA